MWHWQPELSRAAGQELCPLQLRAKGEESLGQELFWGCRALLSQPGQNSEWHHSANHSSALPPEALVPPWADDANSAPPSFTLHPQLPYCLPPQGGGRGPHTPSSSLWALTRSCCSRGWFCKPGARNGASRGEAALGRAEKGELLRVLAT